MGPGQPASADPKARLRDVRRVAKLLPAGVSITDILAEGGQAVVYRGEVRGEAAAVKVYYPGQIHKRIQREVEILGALQCPSISKLLWAGEITVDRHPTPVVATGLIEGSALGDILRMRRMEEAGIGALAFDVAAAIHAMWSRRVVHRDLKPSNIIITPAGRASVIDLGLARHVDRSPLTALGSTWGTYGYLSPEQTRAVRQLTCKSDIFTLAIVLLEALLGEHPSQHDQGRLLAMDLHTGLPSQAGGWSSASMLMRMLHPRPTFRPMPEELLTEFGLYAPPAA